MSKKEKKTKTLGIDERDLDMKIIEILDSELEIVGNKECAGNCVIGNTFSTACKIRNLIHEISGTEPLYKDDR